MRLRHTAALGGLLLLVLVVALPARLATVPPPPADAASCATPAAGDLRFTVDAGSGPRPVVLHVPPRARSGSPLPLVLALGGANQTGDQFARVTGFSRLADLEGFLVVYPTGTGARPFWNISGAMPGKPDDVAFLSAVMDRAEGLACVDRSREYATGVSNGGGMTALAGCALAWRFAAIAPVAGGYGALPRCTPSRPVAVLEVHGDADRVVPYLGRGPSAFGSVPAYLSSWRRANGCSGPARRMPAPGGVREIAWSPCSSGSDVVHVRIAGEPHSWPGWNRLNPASGWSTTWRAWSFFRGHARAPGARPGATPTGGTAARVAAAPQPR